MRSYLGAWIAYYLGAACWTVSAWLDVGPVGALAIAGGAFLIAAGILTHTPDGEPESGG